MSPTSLGPTTRTKGGRSLKEAKLHQVPHRARAGDMVPRLGVRGPELLVRQQQVERHGGARRPYG
eukprot:7870639-Pyramimonas_sp.AAC.1